MPEGEKLTAAQRKAIDRHYDALAKVLADPKKYARFLTGAGIFSGPEYLDVYIEVARKDACPVLMRLVDGIMGRFADAATESIRGVLADIIKAPTTLEAKIARGFVCADMAIREILPALCDVLKKPDEAKKLRALNRVTDLASAELARQAARSVRDVFQASTSASAYDAAYAAAAAYADADAARIKERQWQAHKIREIISCPFET